MLTAYELLFCQLAIGILFAMSAFGKIKNPRAFSAAIADFQILPSGWVKLASKLFLIGEITVIIFIVVGGSLLTVGFLLSIVLLVVFSVALIIVLIRKVKISCNCFGRKEQPISTYDVVRNISFAVCSGLGLILIQTNTDIQSVSILDLILLGLMAVTLVSISVNLVDIAQVFWLQDSNSGGEENG